MNHLARRGADVVHEGIKHVHVSGHGSEEELKLVLSLVRPRYFVPIHGEYRQLARHARVADARLAGATEPVAAGRERRRPAVRRRGRRGSPDKAAGRPRADRRHAHRRGRRRGAARSAAPGRGRPGRAGGRDQQADRARSRGARTSSRAGSSMDDRHEALLADGARPARATRSSRRSVEERTDQGLIKERIRVGAAAASSASGRAGGRSCCRSSWRSERAVGRASRPLSRRVSEFVGRRRSSRARADLADRARQLQPGRPGLVLQRPARRRRRRTSPAASARSSPSCRSSWSATRRT